MKVGDKIKFTKGILGTIIKIEGTYGLIKFKHGQFVYNLSAIKKERIISDI
jgi:preprotein translocase subunit YajC